MIARGILVGVVAAVFVGGSTAGTTSSKTATDHLGGWTAALHYRVVGRAPFPAVRSLRLSVVHDGKHVSDRTLRLPSDCREYPCTATGPGLLELADLGLDAPVAIVWLWTGGAHCCSVATLVPLSHGGAGVDRNFGDSGASVQKLDGERVLASADDRFAYLFASYAASGLPIQVWRFDGTKLIDVTREHPAAVRDDASAQWAAYIGQRAATLGETRGLFAAWAADMCLLGQRPKLERALAIGVDRGFFAGRAASDFSGPHGAAYAKALLRRLTAFGYCR